MTIWMVTLVCVAVEVLVVWISVLVGDFRVDFAAGICKGSNQSELESKFNQYSYNYPIFT